jgi:hypothetical protein
MGEGQEERAHCRLDMRGDLVANVAALCAPELTLW